MTDVEFFLSRAAEYEAHAELVAAPRNRARYLELAALWREMALGRSEPDRPDQS